MVIQNLDARYMYIDLYRDTEYKIRNLVLLARQNATQLHLHITEVARNSHDGSGKKFPNRSKFCPYLTLTILKWTK